MTEQKDTDKHGTWISKLNDPLSLVCVQRDAWNGAEQVGRFDGDIAS